MGFGRIASDQWDERPGQRLQTVNMKRTYKAINDRSFDHFLSDRVSAQDTRRKDKAIGDDGGRVNARSKRWSFLGEDTNPLR